jgi:hypothetical protein
LAARRGRLICFEKRRTLSYRARKVHHAAGSLSAYENLNGASYCNTAMPDGTINGRAADRREAALRQRVARENRTPP